VRCGGARWERNLSCLYVASLSTRVMKPAVHLLHHSLPAAQSNLAWRGLFRWCDTCCTVAEDNNANWTAMEAEVAENDAAAAAAATGESLTLRR
jgi:hypothetical protein